MGKNRINLYFSSSIPGDTYDNNVPLADNLRGRNPFPYLDIGAAAPDVDGDVAELRQFKKEVIAQLEGVDAVAVGAEAR